MLQDNFNEDTGEGTPTPVPTLAPTLTTKPTPKPTIAYQKPTAVPTQKPINVDTTDPTPAPGEEEKEDPTDFDSSPYVSVDENGNIIFDFDAYTKDALGGNSE